MTALRACVCGCGRAIDRRFVPANLYAFNLGTELMEWDRLRYVMDEAARARAEEADIGIDSPLFALPGEVWEHGAQLHEVSSAVAQGGGSGELVNVTPHVAARYARLLAGRAATGRRA
jgi:hypothetical protein